MSPEAPIVDCGPFCAVGFLRTMDKSEFSHSLGQYRTFIDCRFESRSAPRRGQLWALLGIGGASRATGFRK